MDKQSSVYLLGFGTAVKSQSANVVYCHLYDYNRGYEAGQEWLKRQSEAVEEATRNAYERGQAQAVEEWVQRLKQCQDALERTQAEICALSLGKMQTEQEMKQLREYVNARNIRCEEAIGQNQAAAETIESLRQLLERTEQDWQTALKEIEYLKTEQEVQTPLDIAEAVQRAKQEWEFLYSKKDEYEALKQQYDAVVKENQSAGEEIQELTRRLQEKQAQTAYERGWIAFESGSPCDSSEEGTGQAQLCYDEGYEAASRAAFSVRKSDTVTRAEAVIGGIICGTALLLAVVGGILIGRIL